MIFNKIKMKKNKKISKIYKYNNMSTKCKKYKMIIKIIQINLIIK